MLLIPAIDLRGRPLRAAAAGRLRRRDRATTSSRAQLLARYRGLRRRLAARRRSRRRPRRQHRQSRDHRRASPPKPASNCRSAAACATPARSREMLDLGVARVVVGSAAVTKRGSGADLARSDFGAERIALAFDVRLDDDGHAARRDPWRGVSSRLLPLWDAVADFADIEPATRAVHRHRAATAL